MLETLSTYNEKHMGRSAAWVRGKPRNA